MTYLATWVILMLVLSPIRFSIGVPLREDSGSIDKVKESPTIKGIDTYASVATNKENTIFGLDDAISYLSKYGYLRSRENGSEQTIIDPTLALKEFQHMVGIEESGVLDETTKEEMKLPRCGVVDIEPGNEKRRKKRFTYQGSRWATSEIKYHIFSYPSDVDQSVAEEQIKKSFDTWQDHIPVTFKKATTWEPSDITIKFASYEHGDGIPFDGPGRTLAHAFFPQFGGDAHFDDSERFTANRYGGVDLHMVVAHELGHSLGLGHSSARSALMAPIYRGYNPSFRLSQDDIEGIQYIYGPKTRETTSTTTRRPIVPSVVPSVTNTPSTVRTRPPQPSVSNTPALDGIPNFCDIGSVDAITNYEGKTYAFRGSYYVELDRDGIVDGFPQLISSGWKELHDNVDAALHWEAKYNYVIEDGRSIRVLRAPARTYFFKSSLYWRYDEGIGLRSGYPRYIVSGFPGLPANLDAAFVWSATGSTFFIKGSNYYRYIRGVGVAAGYPRPLSDWNGLPSSINAALQWPTNRRNYFFSGSIYYRTRYRSKRIDEGYPRRTHVWWFGCPGDLGMIGNMVGSDNQQERIGEWPEEGNVTIGGNGDESGGDFLDGTSGSDAQYATRTEGCVALIFAVLLVLEITCMSDYNA